MHVMIVSDNPETLDALHAYLAGAGVTSRCTRAVHDLRTVAPEGATATVIFPDDFDESIVLRLVGDLRRERPHLLTLLVTRAPKRYQSFLHDDDRSPRPIVLPRPTFGWDILDAIRDHAVSS